MRCTHRITRSFCRMPRHTYRLSSRDTCGMFVTVLARLAEAGISDYASANRFDPKGTTTRAEAAVIVQNICQKLGK